MSTPRPHIAILGAGPTGLEAALAAAEGGFPFTLYEASDAVAGHIADWQHVRLFTPWSMNVSPRMSAALAAAGKPVPEGDHCPTGGELRESLLVPLAELPTIAPHVVTGCRVGAIGREGLLKHEEIASPERAARPFRLFLKRDGVESIEHADWVLDCTGSYAQPNALGDGGIPAPGERSLGDRITRRVPDFASEREAWAGKDVLLVGGGHSAATAARDLAQLASEVPATRVIWALRGEGPDSGAVEDDPLPERAALTARAKALAEGYSPSVRVVHGVVVDGLEADGDSIRVTLRGRRGARHTETVDRVIALTGSVGDHSLYRQLQVHECYATSGPMKLAAALLGSAGGDCLGQTSHGPEALANPEPGFFILGSKSYGRNSTFLMRVGWEQVGEVFSLLEASA